MTLSRTPASLLDRLRTSSNHEAWSLFVQLYGPLIHGWFQAFQVPHHDACDLSQEVMATVAREMPQFRYDPGRGSFRSWLRAVVSNRLKNYWRARRADRLITGKEPFEVELDKLEAPEGEAARRWNEHHDSYVISRVLMILKTDFDPSTWQAFWWLVVDEVPPAQVAQDMGLSRASVYAAKSRVLRRLRQELEGVLD